MQKYLQMTKVAIDPVIKSRVQTAVYRSAKTNDYKWM